MTTGDLITVLGRYDCGRITAIETGQGDQPIDFVLAEFTDGQKQFHPWEVTSCRRAAAGRKKGPGEISVIQEWEPRERYEE